MCSFIFLRTTAALLTSLLLAPGSMLSASEPIKVVNGGRGWFTKTKADPKQRAHLVARNDVVGQDDTIEGNQAAGPLVLDYQGSTGWYSYECAVACTFQAGTFRDTSTVKVTHLLQVSQWTSSLFKREPKELVALGVRAGGNPSDAVLMQAAQGIHWGPALTRVLEGRYCFRLKALPVSNSSAHIANLNWDRDSDPEGIAPASGLAPGLYSLEKGTGDAACMVEPDGVPAWVLVVPEAQFESANAQWKTESSQIGRLERSGLSAAVATTLRHTVLAGLADAASK